MGWREDDQRRRREAQAEQFRQATSQVFNVSQILPPEQPVNRSMAGAHGELPVDQYTPSTAGIGSRPDTAGQPDPNARRFEQFDRFVRENQVTPPARPPSAPIDKSLLRQLQMAAESGDKPNAPHPVSSYIEKQVPSDAMTAVQTVMEPVAGVVGGAKGLLGDKEAGEAAMRTARFHLPWSPPEVGPLSSELSAERAMKKAGEALDPNLGAEGRAGKAVGAVYDFAENLANLPALPKIPKVNAMARKVASRLHGGILETAREGAHGTLFAEPGWEALRKLKGDTNLAKAQKQRLIEEALDQASMERAAQRTTDLGPEEVVPDMKIGGEEGTAGLTRQAKKSRPAGRWRDIAADTTKDEADEIMWNNVRVAMLRGDEYIRDLKESGKLHKDKYKTLDAYYEKINSYFKGGLDNPIIADVAKRVDELAALKKARGGKGLIADTLETNRTTFDPDAPLSAEQEAIIEGLGEHLQPKGASRAIQEPRPTSEVPLPPAAGKNLAKDSGGVRPVIEGQKVAPEGQAAEAGLRPQEIEADLKRQVMIEGMAGKPLKMENPEAIARRQAKHNQDQKLIHGWSPASAEDLAGDEVEKALLSGRTMNEAIKIGDKSMSSPAARKLEESRLLAQAKADAAEFIDDPQGHYRKPLPKDRYDRAMKQIRTVQQERIDAIPEAGLRPQEVTGGAEPIPEPLLRPETKAAVESAAERVGNPEFAEKVTQRAEELAGTAPPPETHAEQAEKTYAMVVRPQTLPATQRTQIAMTGGTTAVGPHVYQTSGTRYRPPPPAQPAGQIEGPSPRGWEPMFKPDQAKTNPVDVPPPGKFFDYAGIPHPELIQERTFRKNMLEKASAGKSEYTDMPGRQLEVDTAQRAKTDLYHRAAEANLLEQDIRAGLGSGVRQTSDDLIASPRIDKALTQPQQVPGANGFVTRWQLGKSKYKLERLTTEEQRALEGLDDAIADIGDRAKGYGFALKSKGDLVPFEKGGNWPDYSTPQHWQKMHTDPAYMEAYLKELEAVNRHYGHNIAPQIADLRNSILESNVYSETEAAFEHAREIPVHLAAFKHNGKVHETSVFRLGGNGGYIDTFMNRAPRHLSWNHYFGQNFNALGDEVINNFKMLNPNLPTPRSVIEDFAKVFREGGYLTDAEGLENMVMAMHGAKPEGWMDKLAATIVGKTPGPFRSFLNNVMGFHISRMTDEVGKWNLTAPFGQAKQLGGGGRAWKPETLIDTIKGLFGKGRAETAAKGVTMAPFERAARSYDELANAYIKKNSLWKAADYILNKVAMKKFTENVSTRGVYAQADRYFGDLERMAETGVRTGRKDTLLYSVGMPDTFVEALERNATMPAGPAKDAMRQVLKDAYEIQLTKRGTHINQSPMFKTNIEQWDKNPMTAPLALFAREPAQFLGHTVEVWRQIFDGFRKSDTSILGEGSRRALAQGVGFGIVGSGVYFATNVLRELRGQPTSDSLSEALALFMAQATMGKMADLMYPAIKHGSIRDVGKLASPHIGVATDYANPAWRQMTTDDADLTNDMWRDIVVKYAPGKAVTTWLGAGNAALQSLKAEQQSVRDNPLRKAKQEKPKESAGGKLYPVDAGGGKLYPTKTPRFQEVKTPRFQEVKTPRFQD